jgi:hypothetical protein
MWAQPQFLQLVESAATRKGTELVPPFALLIWGASTGNRPTLHISSRLGSRKNRKPASFDGSNKVVPTLVS